MNNNNYKFLLADDHNGNKVLMIVKGNLKKAINNVGEITDQCFPYRDQLKSILEHSTIKISKEKEHDE